MPFINAGKENSADIQLYYEDRGSGKPVLLIHGWPLSGSSWERQTAMLLAAGLRVITYDRRGFGRSSQPSSGYDYDTLAGDTAKVISTLGLRDIALVGFSMGGGEVARYMNKYGGKGVATCAFISSVAPALRKDGNNPDGVDPSVFEGIKQSIEADRFVFLTEFLSNFFNKATLGSSRISNQMIDNCWSVASQSYYSAMLTCVDSWLEDFRGDLKQIRQPTLVIHGEADQIVPYPASGKRMPQFVKHAQLHAIKGAPHGCIWTHATEVNKLLLEFLR
jgi:non-heme chloroperoxidase